MTVTAAQYTDVPDANGQSHVVTATIDGQVWSNIDLRNWSFIIGQVLDWIAAGNSPTPYVAPPAPLAMCLLWQIQAVMTDPSWTGPSWTQVENAVAASTDPKMKAFFKYSGNLIPENSVTLIAFGKSLGMTPDQVAALVQAASKVAIP